MYSDSCELGSYIFLLGQMENMGWVILELEKIYNFLGVCHKELEVYVLFQNFLNTTFDPSLRHHSRVKINLYLKADLSLLRRQSGGDLTERRCHSAGLTVTFWNDCGCRTSCRQLLLAFVKLHIFFSQTFSWLHQRCWVTVLTLVHFGNRRSSKSQ